MLGFLRSSPITRMPTDLNTLDSQESPPRWPKLVLRRADQAAVASLLVVSLLVIVAWCIRESYLRGRLIDIETAEPLAVQFQLDINRADWPEIAVLPNIGEQLAKRIIADRQQHGPFREIADLTRVRGIGPRTVESITPYLLPLPPPTSATVSAKQPPAAAH